MTHTKILKLAHKFSKKLSLADDQGAFQSQTEIMEEFVYKFHKQLMSCINSLGGELFSFTEIKNNIDKNSSKKEYMIVKAINELMKDLYIDLRGIMRTSSEKDAYGGAQRFIEYMTSRSTIAKFENLEFFIKYGLKQKIIVLSTNQLKELLLDVESFIEKNPILAPPEYSNTSLQHLDIPDARLNSDNVTGVSVPKRLNT